MTPLQQHIEDSLEKFDKQNFTDVWAEDESKRCKNFLKQCLLEQVDILRGEVEKLDRYEAYEGLELADNFICKDGNYLKRQDVLDLLDIK